MSIVDREEAWALIVALPFEIRDPLIAEDYLDRRIRIVQRGDAPERITSDRRHRLAAGIQMTAKIDMSEERALAFCDEIRGLESRYPVPEAD